MAVTCARARLLNARCHRRWAHAGYDLVAGNVDLGSSAKRLRAHGYACLALGHKHTGPNRCGWQVSASTHHALAAGGHHGGQQSGAGIAGVACCGLLLRCMACRSACIDTIDVLGCDCAA